MKEVDFVEYEVDNNDVMSVYVVDAPNRELIFTMADCDKNEDWGWLADDIALMCGYRLRNPQNWNNSFEIVVA